MILTTNFTLEQFLLSQMAERMGRKIVAMPEDIENLSRLCHQVLQPLRDAIGKAIFISSGLRPPWLNTLLGGSPHSAHLEGRAADIHAEGWSPLDLCNKIVALGLPFDQVIYEGSWTHVGIAPAAQEARGQILTAHFVSGSPTTYTNGLA